MRPNSPPQITSVESSKPRCLRSRSRRCHGFVGSLANFAMVGCQIGVTVPRLFFQEDLHKPNTAFHQPSRQQAALREGIRPFFTDPIQRLRVVVSRPGPVLRLRTTASARPDCRIRFAHPVPVELSFVAVDVVELFSKSPRGFRTAEGCSYCGLQIQDRRSCRSKSSSLETGGRKPAVQLRVPFFGSPSGSFRTT